MNLHSMNMYVMMLIQGSIHEYWQSACDMANPDVVWFLCEVQNYPKSPVSIIMMTSVYNL
jgi:hypothetical protein